MRPAVVVLGLALGGPPALAALPSADPHGFQSVAEKAEVRLGEPFGYTIQVRHDPADRYAVEGQPQLDPFEATAVRCQTEPSSRKDEALTTCRLRLALFDLGEHDVPDLRLVAHGPAGDRVLTVPGPRVNGVGVIDPAAPTDQLALRKLAPPVALKVRSWRLIGWALGALAGVSLAVAAGIAWRRWRQRPRALLETAPLPPHLRFERRLADLAAERLPQRGLRREYFFRLSEIVREYLGALLGVNALDRTTAELIEVLPRRDSPIDPVALQRWCERADLVKFARHPPTDEECEQALHYARDLLDRTRPGLEQLEQAT